MTVTRGYPTYPPNGQIVEFIPPYQPIRACSKFVDA